MCVCVHAAHACIRACVFDNVITCDHMITSEEPCVDFRQTDRQDRQTSTSQHTDTTQTEEKINTKTTRLAKETQSDMTDGKSTPSLHNDTRQSHTYNHLRQPPGIYFRQTGRPTQVDTKTKDTHIHVITLLNHTQTDRQTNTRQHKDAET